MHLCSCYEKRNLNLHGLINNKYFSDKFLILKFLFSELEHFYSSSSSEKLFFQVRVRSPGRRAVIARGRLPSSGSKSRKLKNTSCLLAD